jgi:hypothetical protein
VLVDPGWFVHYQGLGATIRIINNYSVPVIFLLMRR